ncbi:hypothetical protein MRX96_036689 [Rhipicephalus microplus]
MLFYCTFFSDLVSNEVKGRKHKRPRNLENRPLPTQPRSLEHEGYADKAGRQPLQQHRTTGQEGALLTRSNISEVPAFDSSSPAGIRPSQRAPSPRMASPEGQNVYRGSYSNNCRPLDNLEGPPFQQHYSSQQGASFTALSYSSKKNNDLKTVQIQQLAGLGGSTFGAAARRMLELLLSLEVAVQFSWAGQKGKRKFVDLGVTDVICKAVRRNFPETKKK